MKRRRHSKSSVLPGIAALIGCLILSVGAYFVIQRMEEQKYENIQLSEQERERQLSLIGDQRPVLYRYPYQGEWYCYNQDLTNLLIMGVDKDSNFDYEGNYHRGGQSDFLVLLSIDEKNNRYRAIQINRDTMAEIKEYYSDGRFKRYRIGQIALSHGYGDGKELSCENTVEAVSSLFYGIPIHGYAAFTYDAIAVANDLVGGVTVTIEDDFSAVDPTLIQGQTMTLHGEQAHHYVRSRWYIGDESNLSRMKRQRQYMDSLLKQLKQMVADKKLNYNEFYDALLPYTVTNISSKDALYWTNLLLGSSVSIDDLLIPKGESVMGDVYIEHYLDEDALRDMIMEIFFQKINR